MGCQPPLENPQVSEETPPEPIAESVPEEPTPEVAPVAEVIREIPDSEQRWPKLAIYEDEAAKTIRFTGEMPRQHQMEMLLEQLGKRLTGVEFVNEVTYDRAIRVTNWGNRADLLWLPFFEQVENGTWEYEGGVTRMKGKTTAAVSKSLHRYTPDIMEGRDAKAIDNQLVTE